MARRTRPALTPAATAGAAALALVALAACGDPAADRGPTRSSTSKVTVSPSGLGVGGVDGQGAVAAPGKAVGS